MRLVRINAVQGRRPPEPLRPPADTVREVALHVVPVSGATRAGRSPGPGRAESPDGDR